MRIDRLLGAVTLAAFSGAVLLLTGSTASFAVAEDDVHEGKTIFLAQKCNTCHSVLGAEIDAKLKAESLRGPDLPPNKQLDAEWLTKYLRKEVQLNGKDHGEPSKATDEEIHAVVAWLNSLAHEKSGD